MPGLVATSHSHRATTKSANKSFKSRKATKGSLRDAAKGMAHAERLILAGFRVSWRETLKLGDIRALRLIGFLF